ncbi:MAG: hypothetical protein IJ545_02030 [Alphaproteobacteria bacterium]|nr:hypothetical protein [Alphaproteobacteria bacterium]
MSNISRQWTEEVVLPDGSIAANASDIDRYMKVNQAALASDYSAEYMAKVKERRQKEETASIFADLIHFYKRSIWNAK